MTKYYIVGNRAFTELAEAENYCNDNDFDLELIVEAETTTKKDKYYELQTKGNMNRTSIYHNIFLTGTQLQEPKWIEEIAHLKSGEYCERFIHLNEISEQEYRKNIA